MDKTTEEICQRLKCSQMAESLNKLSVAMSKLNKYQHFRILSEVLKVAGMDNTNLKNRFSFIPGEFTISETELNLTKVEPKTDVKEVSATDWDAEGDEEEGIICSPKGYVETYVDTPEDKWQGFFKGFEVVTMPDCTTSVKDCRKCVEVNTMTTNSKLTQYMRCGVRCFIIDLFSGTSMENLLLVVRMRQTELKVSRELGFPVAITILAKLSPRLQYTGMLQKCNDTCPETCPSGCECSDSITYEKGDEVNLTTSRHWSSRSHKRDIYVNARFLIDDIKKCDFILIGADIQLCVKEISGSNLHCVVVAGGELRARTPVLFPLKCDKFKVSLEELEDITFAREVGIQIIVSYEYGTKAYFKEMTYNLELLDCKSMHLYTRVVLTDLDDDEDDEPNDLKWVVESYDGFLCEVQPPKQVSVLHLSNTADALMKQIYKAQKPILLDPSEIAEKNWIVHPIYYTPIFFYPDKFLFRNKQPSFHFLNLQSILYDGLFEAQLSKMPYCDNSASGIDSLMRSCVINAYEVHAKVILVCSIHACVVHKLAHYRPNIPIIFITSHDSLSSTISLYHNVTMLYFHQDKEEKFKQLIFKYLIFGIVYAKSLELIRPDDNIMMVFTQDPAVEYTDKYLLYKYSEHKFVRHLNEMLFK